KRNRRGHDQTCETDGLRQSTDLLQRSYGRFGINAKQRQEYGPRWNNDCENPQVNLDWHERVPFQSEKQPQNPFDDVRRTDTISEKKTCCRQKQIKYPQIDGEDLFPLINHASLR